MKKLRIAFDIDGTLCTDYDGSYENAKPHQNMIDIVNRLYDKGHYIVVQTARGMGRGESVPGRACTRMYRFTQDQLDSWGVKYHELHLGKLHMDLFVDDKAFGVETDGSSADELLDMIKYDLNGDV